MLVYLMLLNRYRFAGSRSVTRYPDNKSLIRHARDCISLTIFTADISLMTLTSQIDLHATSPRMQAYTDETECGWTGA